MNRNHLFLSNLAAFLRDSTGLSDTHILIWHFEFLFIVITAYSVYSFLQGASQKENVISIRMLFGLLDINIPNAIKTYSYL